MARSSLPAPPGRERQERKAAAAALQGSRRRRSGRGAGGYARLSSQSPGLAGGPRAYPERTEQRWLPPPTRQVAGRGDAGLLWALCPGKAALGQAPPPKAAGSRARIRRWEPGRAAAPARTHSLAPQARELPPPPLPREPGGGATGRDALPTHGVRACAA